MKSCSVIGVVVGSIAAAMTLAAGTSPDKAGAFNAGNVSEARVLAESGNGNNWLVNGGLPSREKISVKASCLSQSP